MYAFDTQSQLTAGFYITPDFSNIFYSFSNHFQRSVYDYTWKQSKRTGLWISSKFLHNVHPFRIGFVQVIPVIVEYTLRLHFFFRTPLV